MPITPTYPGVYIEEIPSGVRTIAGVATSVAAFVDYFPRGPMNQAVEIFSYSDFERTFGGLDIDSEASYAIQQFFLNGGTDAWVVRVASGTPQAATAVLEDDVPSPALTVAAASAGEWGNNLRLGVSWPGAATFDLAISEVDPTTGAVLRPESFLGLTMATVRQVLKQSSQLVVVPPASAVGNRPVPTGTTSADITLPLPPAPLLAAVAGRAVSVAFAGTDADTKTVDLGPNAVVSLDEAAGLLQNAIRAANPTKGGWNQATVRVVPSVAGKGRLQVTAGLGAPDAIITFLDGDSSDTATALGLTLTAGAKANVAAYVVGLITPAGS